MLDIFVCNTFYVKVYTKICLEVNLFWGANGAIQFSMKFPKFHKGSGEQGFKNPRPPRPPCHPRFRQFNNRHLTTDTLCLNLGRLLFKCRPRYSEFPSRFNGEVHLVRFIIKVKVVNIVVLQLIGVKTEDPFRM